MSEIPENDRGWRIARRILIVLAVLATLIAIFYAEEDWRGKRAWENCKRELEAKGETLDWNAYIPPPVPDDQNFFAAPKMQKWFVKNGNPGTNELYITITNAVKVAVITDKTTAADFIAWSDQLQPDFDLIREALKRPYARMDGDYTKPYEIPIVNFVNIRAVALVLAQRAKCDLLLGQPNKALDELTLLNDSRRMMERAPTGEPMTLVDAMVNVAITGLYVDTIGGGFQKQAWQEPQLAALQKQLEQINLLPIVVTAFKSEQAATSRTFETTPTGKIADIFSSLKDERRIYLLFKFAPRGWIYQSMVTDVKLVQPDSDCIDDTNEIIQPRDLNEAMREVEKTIGRFSPYNFFAAVAIPNFLKAWQTTAYNQTKVNEAQIACALERYCLAHGDYPEALDALTPQFIEQIPHDIIGGQPLHYRRTDDRKFLLYSVGWNETDDGGQETSDKTPNGSIDYTKGDWVWKN